MPKGPETYPAGHPKSKFSSKETRAGARGDMRAKDEIQAAKRRKAHAETNEFNKTGKWPKMRTNPFMKAVRGK